MSEFETNPEAALRSKQLELETNVSNLNEKFEALQNGDLQDKRTKMEAEATFALATFTKRELYQVLIKLHDFKEIANRLEAEIYIQKEGYGNEASEYLFVEPVFKDVFGEDLDNPEIHPDVKKIAMNVKNEQGIGSFDEDDAGLKDTEPDSESIEE